VGTIVYIALRCGSRHQVKHDRIGKITHCNAVHSTGAGYFALGHTVLPAQPTMLSAMNDVGVHPRGSTSGMPARFPGVSIVTLRTHAPMHPRTYMGTCISQPTTHTREYTLDRR
jgi:hypothetical protein